jgi:hypothetical protein
MKMKTLRRCVSMSRAAYSAECDVARRRGMPWSTWADFNLRNVAVRDLGVAEARKRGLIGEGAIWVQSNL